MTQNAPQLMKTASRPRIDPVAALVAESELIRSSIDQDNSPDDDPAQFDRLLEIESELVTAQADTPEGAVAALRLLRYELLTFVTDGEPDEQEKLYLSLIDNALRVLLPFCKSH